MGQDLLVGKMVGSLHVLTRLPDRKKGGKNVRAVMLCKCACGKRIQVPRYYLIRKGNPKTHCGCQRKGNPTTHYKPEYSVWYMMIRRCTDENHIAYENYGGRGIKVCDRWSDPTNGFKNFLYDMGHRPSMRHTLDRIKNDKGYDVFNCRWTTAEVQAANKRSK